MFLVDKKRWSTKKLVLKNVLIPWYPISYLTIASYGFFFGRLRVPTRRCNLVVPVDWGWGRSNKIYYYSMNGIWSNCVDYSSPISKAHWMDSAYLFPVIAYKYQIRKLVLYDKVVQIPIVLMVDVVLQLICIVMTNPNVKFPLLQYLDWFMTLMQVEMPVWFSFMIDHISI